MLYVLWLAKRLKLGKEMDLKPFLTAGKELKVMREMNFRPFFFLFFSSIIFFRAAQPILHSEFLVAMRQKNIKLYCRIIWLNLGCVFVFLRNR